MRRFFVIAAAVLAVIVFLSGGGYAAFWYLAANSAQGAIEDWIDARNAAGSQASLQGLRVSGFPGKIRMQVDGLELANSDQALDWRWTGQNIEALIDPRNPRQIDMVIRGPQSLVYRSGNGSPTTEIRTERTTFQLDLNEALEVEGVSLDAAGLSLHEGAAEPVTAGRFQLRANLGPGGGAVPDETRISFRLDALVMPAHARGPLGNTMDFIQADIEVHGALFPGDLAVALADWREADGALEIRESQLRWGTLDLAGRGALTLDANMRPSGWIDAQIRGYEITIEAFHAAGLLDDEERESVRSVLSFLGQRGPQTAVGQMMRTEGGLIYVGPVSLGRVGPLITVPNLR